jgi:hypothetical protein
MTPQEKAIEVMAKLIFAYMPYDGPILKPKPQWVDGGNSIKQGIARFNAKVYIDAFLDALEAEGRARRGRCIEMPDGHWTCGTDPMGVVSKLSVLIIKL